MNPNSCPFNGSCPYNEKVAIVVDSIDKKTDKIEKTVERVHERIDSLIYWVAGSLIAGVISILVAVSGGI